MFKSKFSEEEIIKDMQINLNKKSTEYNFQFEKFSQVLDLLNDASKILDGENLIQESNEIINVMESISNLK